MAFIYEPGLVACFMGTLGAGKSLHMSFQAYLATKLQNADVYANYEVFFNRAQRINGLRHLVQIENGLLCIDELQSIIDSRTFAKNVDITQWLMLIRKVGLGMFYTTQHIDFVDVRCRRITDIIFEQEKRMHYGKKSTLVNVYRLYGDSARQCGRFVLVHKPELYKLYNTNDRRVKLTMDGYEMPFNLEAFLSDEKPEKAERRRSAA